jgi:predicted ATPase/DNA-binding SARP family transcriptional activator
MNRESPLQAGVESHRASCPLTLRLFGPFEACVGGAPLPRLRARKGQWLLALLTLHAHRDVERAWLAGTLWPDSLEPQAFNNLRVNLTDLRRALGPEAGRLHSPTILTLRLDLSGADADLLAFDQAIASGEIPALEQAVALYRGPLLEGCAEPWAFQEREVREQSYLVALETLARHAAEEENPAAAERYLRRAVAADPLRESTQRTLMQALAADGNYAAALVAYRELRLLLHREVNAEPDPETRALFEQIQTEARRRAENSPPPRNARLSPGTRRLCSSPSLSSGTTRHNLPFQLTSFIGREPQVAAIPRLLHGRRLVTLTGAGGCGKTRLALEVAAGQVEEFTGGVWLVELAALADHSLVPQTVGSTLGVREEPGRPLAQTLVEYFGTKSVMLVMDNCEHLLAASAQLVEILLRACPNLRILATSREALGIAGETTCRVPSLSLPDLKRLPPAEELTRYEAACLFTDRATAALPAFKLTDQNAVAVAQVCSRLDGIPLAIELAAARVKVLPVEQIAARLDDRFRLLTSGSRTALPRHQTLRALIDWSYDLLTEPERMLLRRLAVFAGGWTLEAAETVCAGDGLEAQKVLGLHMPLVEKSLVIYEADQGEARYRLLETVRQYGWDRLAAAGETGAVRGRHRDWFLAFAERVDPELQRPDQAVWFARLEAEHDNIRAALAWCQEEVGGVDVGLRLASRCMHFWTVHGHLQEGSEWLTSLLAQRAEPTVHRSSALSTAGYLAYRQGQCERAAALLEESLALARALGDRRCLGTALSLLGLVTSAQGNSRQAAGMFRESLVHFRELDDKWNITLSVSCLAKLMEQQGEDEQAIALYEEELALARELNYPRHIAWSNLQLGGVLWRQGQYERAARLGEESLARFQELGQRGTANSLLLLGLVAQGQGDPRRAATLLEESLTRFQEQPERDELLRQQGMTRCLHYLGEVAQSQGEYDRARMLHQESLSHLRELGDRARDEDRQTAANSLEGLAGVAIADGRPERAARLLGAGDRLRQGIKVPRAPIERADHERRLTAVRAALGEEAFAAAWAAGRVMSLDEATTLALEDTTARSSGP